MPDTPHLLIPYAASRSAGARAALPGLRLPNLERLLSRLSPSAADADDAQAEHPPAMPHERALARALGLPADAGRTPWAAHHLAQTGRRPGTEAWAWFTPCHWQIGMDQVSLQNPDTLALTDEEARALLAAVAPLASEDGIELQLDTPGRWLARGEVFRDLATASLDRVIDQNVKPWLPTGPGARLLHRLQSELQMLLYTHPVNDARAARRLPAVNAFWISGAGPLDHPAPPSAVPVMPDTLRAAALREDWPAWAQAWQQIDAHQVAQLLATLQQTGRATLTLCSEHSAHRFEVMPQTLRTRLSRVFTRPSVTAVLESL